MRSEAFARAAVLGALVASVAVTRVSDARRAASGVVEVSADGDVTVDWTRGAILARGAAAADLRAPSPAVARVGARRAAVAQARARAQVRAQALARAGAGDTWERRAAEAEVVARLERAAARAGIDRIDYGSDGSVAVVVALPLEAVRLAVVGFPAPPAPPDTVTGVIVDARGVLTRPALGFWLRGGEADASDAGYAGPVVFYRDPTRAGADPRLGARVWRVRATAVAGGVVTVESAPASSQAASKPAAKATVQGAAALSALTRERPLVAVILGAE